MTARATTADYVMLYLPRARAERIRVTLDLAEARIRKGGDTVLADMLKQDAIDVEAQLYAP